MKRLLIAAVMAVAVLAGTQGQARANGYSSCGFGFGISFSFTKSCQSYPAPYGPAMMPPMPPPYFLVPIMPPMGYMPMGPMYPPPYCY